MHDTTLDEARLMANVNARAQRLFENGYRARWIHPPLLGVRNGEGTVYQVNTQAQTCDCPFFLKSGHPCKHVLGWRKLLVRQRACRLWITAALLRVWGSLDDTPYQGNDDTPPEYDAPPVGHAAIPIEAPNPMPRSPVGPTRTGDRS